MTPILAAFPIPLTLSMTDDVASLIIIFGVGGTIAVIAIGGTFLINILRTHAREKTKREVAAYVAEGSLSPEDAERIIEAGMSAQDFKKS